MDCCVDEECCWICLCVGSPDQPLARPCACPRPVHSKCLARWMLQCAGRSEEKQCRFCNQPYAVDWRETLAPAAQPAAPVMAIYFEGQVHRVQVHPGPDGKARFEQQIRELLQLEDDEDFDVEFECRVPQSSTLLHLDGMDAFDAASHCAALTAAERAKAQADAALASPRLAASSSSAMAGPAAGHVCEAPATGCAGREPVVGGRCTEAATSASQ